MRWYGLTKDDSVFLKHILDEINFLEESSEGIVWDVVKNEIPDIKLKVEMMLREFERPD